MALSDKITSDYLTVTVHRSDALCLVMGPLDYAMKQTRGEVPADASILRLRQDLAEALRDD